MVAIGNTFVDLTLENSIDAYKMSCFVEEVSDNESSSALCNRSNQINALNGTDTALSSRGPFQLVESQSQIPNVGNVPMRTKSTKTSGGVSFEGYGVNTNVGFSREENECEADPNALNAMTEMHKKAEEVIIYTTFYVSLWQLLWCFSTTLVFPSRFESYCLPTFVTYMHFRFATKDKYLLRLCDR